MDFFMIQIMGGFYDPIQECPQMQQGSDPVLQTKSEKHMYNHMGVFEHMLPPTPMGIISFPILMPAWGVPNGIRHTQMSYCWL